MTQFVEKDEGDVPKGDSDDEPLVCLTHWNRKVRVAADSKDQAPLVAISKDASTILLDDASQAPDAAQLLLRNIRFLLQPLFFNYR